MVGHKRGRTANMATHAYTKNRESPLGKEINTRQWDTLIFYGEHVENVHWCLVEYINGQVGYAPAAYLVDIPYTTEEEEERDATKKGQHSSTEEIWIGGWIGQEGERKKRRKNSCLAAVIDDIKINSRIFVRDFIVWKKTKQARVGQIILILSMFGHRVQGYGNSKRMSCSGTVERLLQGIASRVH